MSLVERGVERVFILWRGGYCGVGGFFLFQAGVVWWRGSFQRASGGQIQRLVLWILEKVEVLGEGKLESGSAIFERGLKYELGEDSNNNGDAQEFSSRGFAKRESGSAQVVKSRAFFRKVKGQLARISTKWLIT